MSSAAWQIHAPSPQSWRSPAALSHLQLRDVPKPSPSSIPPKSVLVRIRAAAINARDMMVVAHDSVYELNHKEGLTPCADGAGEVEAVGEGSVWKVGEKVVLNPNDWIDGYVSAFLL